MAGIRVVLLGPPGAGKGTQAKLLQDMFEACQISTGDILRKAVAEKSPLGEKAASYLESGALVPDDLILNLVAERVKEKDCANGFLLDGFPRTVAQADGLQQILESLGLKLDGVLSVQVPPQVIVERLSGRRTCKSCGAMYHIEFEPPKKDGVCDQCGGALYQRSDDSPETIAARLKVYEDQTAPLVDYYRHQGLLRDIDGVGSVEEIQKRVAQALGGRVQ
ncbi:MAG: adenylate kinase [Candidatus Binatia bacterium]